MPIVNEAAWAKRGTSRNLFRYWKLVCTSVTCPFIVPSFSRYDKKVRTGGTEQHLVNVETGRSGPRDLMVFLSTVALTGLTSVT